MVDSPGKRKTIMKLNEQDFEKGESIEGQQVEETTVQKENDNVREILIKKGMKSKEMTGNDNINIGLNKQESASQTKQTSHELIQDNNYHNNLSKQRHIQTMQLQLIKIPSTKDTQLKDKDFETQNKKLEWEEKLHTPQKTYKEITQKIQQKKHIEEKIEDVMAVEIRSIQAKAKQ